MTTQGNGNNVMIQGRLIWTLGADLFAGKQKTDMQTNQPILNPDQTPVVEYGFGLAIPKIDPATGQPTAEYQKIWKALHDEAFTLYPTGQLPPGFAMKYKDGDGVDHNGKSFGDREGYAGHIVISCTTRIPIKYFKFEGGNNVMVSNGIKCGDYVKVQMVIKAHPAKGQGKAGLYVNPGAVQLIQAGKEIINSPSGDQIFGQDVPAYAGQVVADVAAPMPGQLPPAQAAPLAAAPLAAAPLAAAPMPGQLPPAQAAPHYGVLPQTHQPAPLAAAPLAAAPLVAAPMPGQLPPAGYVAPTMPGNVPPVQTVMPGQIPSTAAPLVTGVVPTAYPSNVLAAAPTMPGMP